MANKTPPSPPSTGGASAPSPGESETVREVELLKVVVTREGQQVSAQWAIHPQMKQDLLPQEWKELSDLMGQVSSIVGTRFSQVLKHAQQDPPQGTA